MASRDIAECLSFYVRPVTISQSLRCLSILCTQRHESIAGYRITWPFSPPEQPFSCRNVKLRIERWESNRRGELELRNYGIRRDLPRLETKKIRQEYFLTNCAFTCDFEICRGKSYIKRPFLVAINKAKLERREKLFRDRPFISVSRICRGRLNRRWRRDKAYRSSDATLSAAYYDRDHVPRTICRCSIHGRRASARGHEEKKEETSGETRSRIRRCVHKICSRGRGLEQRFSIRTRLPFPASTGDMIGKPVGPFFHEYDIVLWHLNALLFVLSIPDVVSRWDTVVRARARTGPVFEITATGLRFTAALWFTLRFILSMIHPSRRAYENKSYKFAVRLATAGGRRYNYQGGARWSHGHRANT